MLKEKDLREKKEELRKEWEECFETKLDDVCNEEGLEKFYDDDTSVQEATDMLTAFGVALFVEEVIGKAEVVGVAIVKKVEEDEPKTETPCGPGPGYCKDTSGKFAVLRKADRFVYGERFENPDDAERFIKEICINSELRRIDLSVIQEMD